ncbi:hypothetical protein AVEN_173327-1 [Araneus ventricosus]|uniref:HTH psq-type domain-containing protein n=1 Tax=Araneus ventricosus TaxID=182803 RepID=A0A4Y2VI20_ARAVE|nr:hypothetical protein AVEN_173327-1 [Araneus ventricosus]
MEPKIIDGAKRKCVLLTVEQKFQIIRRIGTGETLTKLSKEFDVGVSTVGDMRLQSCLRQNKLPFKPVANLGFRSGRGAEVIKTSYRRDECQTSRLK